MGKRATKLREDAEIRAGSGATESAEKTTVCSKQHCSGESKECAACARIKAAEQSLTTGPCGTGKLLRLAEAAAKAVRQSTETTGRIRAVRLD